MTRSLRAMVAAVVGGAVILAVGIAQRQSDAQEATQAKPEDDSRSKDREALLDELEEVRVREEVLKMRRDAARQWLQQQVQASGMGRFGGGMGGGGRHPQEAAEEYRKAVERSLKEAEAEYLKTSKELAKITRTRSELERRVGEEPPSKPKGDRAANDQIRRVGEVVRQVQDEAARFRQGGQSRREQDRTSFIRVGNHIVNPGEIVCISPAGELFRVDFTGGEPLILNKRLFEELEKKLPIRGR